MKKDFTGQKYGLLTATKPKSKRRNGSIIWEFLCECGNVVERSPAHLSSSVNRGSIPNCGCREKKDYTLHKYGMIIFTKPTNRRSHGRIIWEGMCECGKLVERVPGELARLARRGSVSSCGCARRKGYTGKKYGMLTAIRPTLLGLKGDSFWEFRCECGEIVERVPAELARTVRRGQISSCGCSYTLPEGIAVRNRVLRVYKSNAKIRGHEWELTDQEAFSLFEGDCVICGDPPSNIRESNNGDFIYNGIDRINNKEGYTQENCVSCCGRCNRIKFEMTMDELKIHIRKMHDHLFSESCFSLAKNQSVPEQE